MINPDDFRAEALRLSGRADLVLVDGLDLAEMPEVLFRYPTPGEYHDYADGIAGGRAETETRNTFILRLAVAPARELIRAQLDRFALLPTQLSSELEILAGAARTTIVPLKSAEAEECEATGLAKEDLKALLSTHDRGGLVAVTAETDDSGPLRFILKRPSSMTVSAITNTRERGGTGYGQACLDAAVDCLVRPTLDEAKAAFLRWPALPDTALAMPIVNLAKVGGNVRRKKL